MRGDESVYDVFRQSTDLTDLTDIEEQRHESLMVYRGDYTVRELTRHNDPFLSNKDDGDSNNGMVFE